MEPKTEKTEIVKKIIKDKLNETILVDSNLVFIVCEVDEMDADPELDTICLRKDAIRGYCKSETYDAVGANNKFHIRIFTDCGYDLFILGSEPFIDACVSRIRDVINGE